MTLPRNRLRCSRLILNRNKSRRNQLRTKLLPRLGFRKVRLRPSLLRLRSPGEMPSRTPRSPLAAFVAPAGVAGEAAAEGVRPSKPQQQPVLHRQKYDPLLFPLLRFLHRRAPPKASSCSRSGFRGPGRVPGSSATTSPRFRATYCDRYCLTILRNRVFRTSSFQICDLCCGRDCRRVVR
jgi:hypothetical protein